MRRWRGVQHFVYTSVGSAHKRTGIPHFDNKSRIEETVRRLRFASHVLSVIERRRVEKALPEKVDLVGGDTKKRSFLVLKEGGHLVSAVQPVSQLETATQRVSGVTMRLEPSGEVLGRIGRLLEEQTIRPDVATVYALQDVAQTWKDIAGNLPGVHGMSPSGPEAARRKSHGKIVSHGVTYVLAYVWSAEEVPARAESSHPTGLNHKQEEIQSWWAW